MDSAKKKRIAILVGQAEEEYQSRFIKGCLEQAFVSGFDVCVFSMYRKYQDTPTREAGESNIFRLINYSRFDGVIVLRDSIQTAGTAQWLDAKLHEIYHGPVFVFEHKSDYFKSVVTDGYTPIVKLITHLIEDHGFKDIAFLTGKKWHEHSIQRMKAYEDTMITNGLEVREDRKLYGDFWYTSGEMCIDTLLKDGGTLPEAIACANDCMAIGVCEALENRGYHVPEDVAVVGFDGSAEGRQSPKPITSAVAPARECGKYAVDYIKATLEGREIDDFAGEAIIITGFSCGCKDPDIKPELNLRKQWQTEISEDGFLSINNSFSSNLMEQRTLNDFLNTVHEYAYQLEGATEFHLCLQTPWIALARDEVVNCINHGYTEKMYHAVSYKSDDENHVGLKEEFETKIMLPELDQESDKPRAYFFTPIFYEEACFGYGVISYGDEVRLYDEIYRLWIETVARGFECLRRTVEIRATKKKYTGKFAGKRLGIGSLSDEEKLDLETVEKILDENLFTYNYQPIVSAEDGEIYSYEALMRSDTERFVSPLDIIKYANMLNRIPDVEKATFINIITRVEQNKETLNGKKVFINSIPGTTLDQKDFDKIRELMERNFENLVIEITEEAELTDEVLDNMKKRLRELGIQTAVDDYGTGYSNITNLLRYTPDYVKIDRSLISDIQNKPQKQFFVRNTIEFCHENSMFALAEGVETSEEMRMLIHFGVDLIQGYYTGRPAKEMIQSIDPDIKQEIIQYQSEHKAGSVRRKYKAGRANRVSLSNLARDGYTDISVGEENPVYRDVTFVGTPGLVTGIRMQIRKGFEGRLTLDNTFFAGDTDNPCIELEEEVNLTLVLQGECILKGSGLSVPDKSKLTLEGEGSLEIVTDDMPVYAAVSIQSNIHSAGGAVLKFNGNVVELS
ncbi:MAG: EAL domain-containing protein [Eubacterium sp.]|nr:EAL domain-containing protein [Eubacterium sp.]